MKKHELKILPEHFAAVVSGEKKAEFRINDRGYSVGDLVCLFEYGWLKDCDGLEGFSGQHVWVRITHVTDLHPWKPGYVMLSIERGPIQMLMPSRTIIYPGGTAIIDAGVCE